MPRKEMPKTDILNSELIDEELGMLGLTDFSWSRLDAYDWCSRQYKYRYCDGLTDGWTRPLAIGSAVHDTLESAVKYGVEDQTELVGFLLQAIEKNDPDNLLTDDEVAQARSQVTEVFNRMQMSTGEVSNILNVEWGFRYIIGRAVFTGFVDVIALDEDEDGQFIHIIDYKTGSRKKKRTKTHGQTKLYAIAAKRLYPGQRVKASLYWTKEDYIDTYEYSQEELDEFEVWAAARVDEIIEDDNYDVTKDIFKCAYCHFANEDVCKYGLKCAQRFNHMRNARARK